MKPFDLERALAGEPVMMRDGDEAKLGGGYNPEAREFHQVVGWDSQGRSREWRGDGMFSNDQSRYDLVMAPKKRTVWVNLYPRLSTITAQWFDSEDDANVVNGEAVRIGGKAWPLEIEE